MATKIFTCPNCGAPLDYNDTDASTIRCPFCETSLVVPEELRPAKSMPFDTVNVVFPNVETPFTRSKSGVGAVVAIGLVICW
jgi:DNA-directed RNA polymerase subunit RPC12/RpoP